MDSRLTKGIGQIEQKYNHQNSIIHHTLMKNFIGKKSPNLASKIEICKVES